MGKNHTTTEMLEQRVQEGDVIYVAGHPDNLHKLHDPTPFGKKLEVIDITQWKNKAFFDLLARMNAVNHGGSGLTSDKWVILDCGLIPGAYFGFAREVSNCDDELREKLRIKSGDGGLVPVSEFCIIPRASTGAWTGHTLSSAVQGKNYGLLSKLVGLRAWEVEHYTGVAQYTNNAVKTHCQIADLELRTIMTPVHDYPETTFIYEHHVDQESLEFATRKERPNKLYSFFLDPHDTDQKKEMQEKTEKRQVKYSIVFPGHVEREGKVFVPIKEE